MIITHIHPDLDAITSCWLIRRFYPDWQEAEIGFVSAGSTYKNQDVDSDENILHVDTGLGKFDHHQNDKYTSASQRIFEFLVTNHYINDNLEEPLGHLVHHVTDIDHFAEVHFPDPTNDRYDFMLSQIIEGLNAVIKDPNEMVLNVFTNLDAVLYLLKNKIKARSEIEKGFIFQSKWGKTLAMETKNEEAMKLALKMDFALVIRKDPEKGNVRIKTLPKHELDLTTIYTKLKSADKNATWFLHSSKNILLNGSTKGPTMTPTVLPLKSVIEIIKEI